MVWALGDIQGCYSSLQKLLLKINFNPKTDKLWIAGDLVNRGEQSLEVLEYLYEIRESIEVVLGNHDISLIAAYYKIKKSNPTIDPILKSDRADVLVEWLRKQKFLHVDYKLGYCMSHAGISPEFDLGMAIEYAKRVEREMSGSGASAWLKKILKSGTERFDRDASNIDIDRYIVSSFTRMRYCHKENKLDFEQKGSPSEVLAKKGLTPWFDCPHRKEIELKILFGHWSTLGLYGDENVLALDTGCLWGRELTAARIDTDEVEIVSVDCSKI